MTEHHPKPRRINRVIGFSTGAGILLFLLLIVAVALITGRFPEDNPVANIGSMTLLALVCGGGLGASVGVVVTVVRELREPAPRGPRHQPPPSQIGVEELLKRVEQAKDPWYPPVAACRESARGVDRAIRELGPSAARDWPDALSDTAHGKLAEVDALADLGRLLLPGREREDVAAVRVHEVFGRLTQAAAEFAALEAEVLRLVGKAHADDADLDQVRLELELLDGQLEVLKPTEDQP